MGIDENFEDEQDDIVILTDEDGNEESLEILDVITYQEKDYVILLPVDEESEEVVILQVDEADEDGESYIGVEDDRTVELLHTGIDIKPTVFDSEVEQRHSHESGAHDVNTLVFLHRRHHESIHAQLFISQGHIIHDTFSAFGQKWIKLISVVYTRPSCLHSRKVFVRAST